MKTRIYLKRFGQIFLALWALWSLGGCERHYLWYDAELKDGVRMITNGDDTISASKSGYGDWVSSSIRIELVGFAADYDRHFKVEVVDTLTTVPDDMYLFADTCYIPANETYGILRFLYARSADTTSLGFRLEENEHFRPVMDYQVCVILYPAMLGAPSWWEYSNQMFGEWSERIYELFFQFYHAVEQTEPYVWSTYFESKLGPNMEYAYYGYSRGEWKPPYKELLRKHVVCPLYDHLKAHPEDGDYTKIPDPYDV